MPHAQIWACALVPLTATDRRECVHGLGVPLPAPETLLLCTCGAARVETTQARHLCP